MRKVWLWGITLTFLVCPLAIGGWAQCNASGDIYLSNGWGRVDGDTMDLTAALADFNSAISFDAACTPAYVARALVKLAQIYDTNGVRNLRKAFGDTTTYATLMTDTSPHNDKRYIWVADTMDADDFQSALGQSVLPILNSALNDLTTAEAMDSRWQMDVPGRFLSSDPSRPKRVEVDHSDVHLFHGLIMAAKAAIYMATAYNLNVGRDWREFKEHEHDDVPDGDTFSKHVYNTANSNFFTLRGTAGNDSFTNALGFIKEGDTAIFNFLKLTKGETNTDFLQDTDLVPYLPNGRRFDTAVFDWINDSDVSDDTRNHDDTFTKLYNGLTLGATLKKGNKDLDSVTIRPRSVFDVPFTRTLVPTVSVLPHGYEFGEAFFPDPTFGGLLPGMTKENLFLVSHETDTYFVVTSLGTTIDIDALFPTNPKKEIDVKFDISGGAGPVTIQRSASGAYNNKWVLSLTPKTGVPSHLRIFYQPHEEFSISEKAGLDGELDSTLIYIVPWAMSGLNAIDAGLNYTAFTNNYTNLAATINMLGDTWGWPATQTYDTLVPFRFGSDDAPSSFKPVISSRVFPDPSNPNKIVSEANINRFGWFMLAEQEPVFKPVRGFIEGDTDDWLDDSFVVKIVNGLGNPVPGKVVTFLLPTATSDRPSGASVGSFDSAVKTTDAAGSCSTTYKMGNKPGVYKITVSAQGIGNAFLFAFTTGYTPHPANIWRMISVPVYPDTPVPPAVNGETMAPPATASETTARGRIGLKMSTSLILDDDFSSYKLFYWDPSQTNPSADFADAGHRNYITPSQLQMGRAYWFKTTVSGVLDAVHPTTFKLAEIDELPETILLPLHVGWNQIGTPYAISIASKELLVDTGKGQPLPIDSMPATVLIHQLYWIAPSNLANPGAGYSQGPGTSNAEVGLFPFGGYWLKIESGCANGSCTMVFPPYASGPSNGVVTEGGTGGAAPPYILSRAPGLRSFEDDWTIQLYVVCPTGFDYENFVGVRPTAAKAACFYEPPLAPGGVSLSFVAGSDKYSQHLRPYGEGTAWDLEIHSANAGPVTINTSNVGSVPDGTPVTLRDETTGKVIDLRAGNYSYESGADEKRKFTFAAGSLDEKSGWFGSAAGKIMYPTACLAGRWFGGRPVASMCRLIRDSLLSSGLGRVAVAFYYSFAAF